MSSSDEDIRDESGMSSSDVDVREESGMTSGAAQGEMEALCVELDAGEGNVVRRPEWGRELRGLAPLCWS